MILLYIFGGAFVILLIFGFIYDIVTKRRRSPEDIRTGARNVSDSNRIYTEMYMNEIRNRMDDFY